jgi:uncharacterized iron-regulated protein
MRRWSLIASMTAVLLSAAAPPALNDLTSFALMRNNGGTPAAVTVAEAAEALKEYDVIFFGEFHDHPGNHNAEMALFSALYARAPALSLSLEQFERDVQNVLDDYMSDRIGEELLKRNGRAWSNYAEAYRPLVEFAKENRLPVIAANAPASFVRCVGQDGPEALSRATPERRGFAAAELHLDTVPYRDKFVRFLREDPLHGAPDSDKSTGAPTAAELRGFAAQVTRDDTMAESIFLHLQLNPGRKVVHVTGNFHVEAFLGTAERLTMRAPQLKVAVVAPIEVENPRAPALKPGDEASGNFLVLLRTLPKRYANDAEEKEDVERLRAQFKNIGKAAANRPPCTP